MRNLGFDFNWDNFVDNSYDFLNFADTAAGAYVNVDKQLNPVQPKPVVINPPAVTQPVYQPGYTSGNIVQTGATSNNTMIYVGIGAAVLLLTVVLLTKRK